MDRPTRPARRSHADIRTETIVAERAAVIAFARVYRQQIGALIAAGKLGAAEGSLLADRVRCFADQIGQGLHVGGGDAPAVRSGMRAVVCNEGNR